MTKLCKKKCGKCKRIKLFSCFTKDKSTADGLAPICKECKREYERIYKKALREQRKFNCIECTPARGIENESQIDSVIREMAELQASIDYEKAQCEKRISLIKKYTEEIIEPFLSHKISLHLMFLNFLKNQKIKLFSRQYRFGQVSFLRGKLNITLYAEKAGQMRNRP
jgi:hypothetical protein